MPEQQAHERETTSRVAASSRTETLASPGATRTAAASSRSSDRQSAGGDGTYTVRRGDTLAEIAEKTLGDAGRWRELWEANRAKVRDPSFILPGMVLRVPGTQSSSGGRTPSSPTPTPQSRRLPAESVREALEWYESRRPLYPKRVVTRIQQKVGASPDGVLGPLTVQAIAAWQSAHRLAFDGMAGDRTLTAMFGEDIRPEATRPTPESSQHDEPEASFERPHGVSKIYAVFGKPGKNQSSFAMRAGPGGRTINVTCHKKIGPILQSVFKAIHEAGLSDHIHSYDGCYVYRTKRKNGSAWSTHAWGIAIDINASQNPMVGQKNLRRMKVSDSQKVLAPFFEQAGFSWGKSFGDPMHFQYCTGY